MDFTLIGNQSKIILKESKMSTFKEISKSITGIASAVTAVAQAGASVTVSSANIATTTIDGVGSSINNLVDTSTIYSKELVLDAQANAEMSAIKRGILVNATKKVAKDTEKLSLLEEKLADSIITEMLEDL